ncbi:thiamine-phosphate kinase [Virgibacillus sp. W0181]|uniref:thiamine-phosphate kinase n=1 Tax=Virgibacillus sp. W0181 TaxID=3391581 RepID=UPI003F6E132E
MNEFAFINAIKQKSYKQPSVIKGIGDDASVIRQMSQDIVTAVDTFVEGIHFTQKTIVPFDIGYRALAANVSDLAAMGSVPAFYLVSITVPKTLSETSLINIFKGMKSLASDYGMDLIGGDTVSGYELSISVTVIGYVERGKARYRSLARVNDVVFTTGTIGDSRAGLHVLQHPGDYKDKQFFIDRHVRPEPRVQFSRGIAELNRVALNDVSDGIANEAGEIAEASNVDIVLDPELIPESPFFTQFSSKLQYEWKLFGGEDFELLGTVPQADWNAVQTCAEKNNLRITKIGKVICSAEGGGRVYAKKGNQLTLLERKGYTHLSR